MKTPTTAMKTLTGKYKREIHYYNNFMQIELNKLFDVDFVNFVVRIKESLDFSKDEFA